MILVDKLLSNPGKRFSFIGNHTLGRIKLSNADKTGSNKTRNQIVPKIMMHSGKCILSLWKSLELVTVKSFKLIESDNPGKMFSFICNYTFRRQYHPT